MAKKTSKPKKPIEVPEEKPLEGYIHIELNSDGTYDIITEVQPTPQNLAAYANVLADIIDGRLHNTLIEVFNESDSLVNNQIGQYLSLFVKKYKNSEEPLIPADKVFRPGKMK